MSHAIRALIAIVITVASLPIMTATGAATGLELTCTPPSSASLTFAPPLTNTPQPVTNSVSRQYGPCVAPNHPGITAGSSTASALYPAGTCERLLGSNPLTITITWNTGQTSTLSGNNLSNIIGGALVSTSTGTVTAGVFAGGTFVHNVVYLGQDLLLCNLGLGAVSSLYGLITLQIIAP